MTLADYLRDAPTGIFGAVSEVDPFGLGDYALGQPIGNSGLYKRGDESQAEFAQRVRAAMANPAFGTSGISSQDLLNRGAINTVAPIDVNGVQYKRIGEDLTDPNTLERYGPKAKAVAAQLAAQQTFDPTLGFLVPYESWRGLETAGQADNADSEDFFDSGVNLAGLMAGVVGGMGALAGAGAGGAGGLFTNAYADALAGTGAFGGAAGGGLTLADATGLTGTLSDAPAIGAGTFGDSFGGGGLFSDAYEQALAGAGPFAEGGFSLSNNFLQSLAPNFPGAQSSAFAGPGSTLGGGAVGAGSGGSFFSDLFTPKNLLSAGTNLIGGLANAAAANKAAGAQIDASNASNALLRDMYNQNRADLAPWRETGVAALGRLRDMLTPGNQFTALQADPGYQFRVDQGNKAIERSAAARGKLFSPQTMNAVGQRTQDVASNEFGNVSNRLMSIAGLGQTATNTGVAAGQSMANQQAQNLTGAGNARASGYVGGANALTGGLSSFLRDVNENSILDQILKSRGLTNAFGF